MTENKNSLKPIFLLEGPAFRAVRDTVGQMVRSEKPVYESLVEIAEPLQRLILTCVDNHLNPAFDFMEELYHELHVAHIDCVVACIPFERKIQPALYYAMHTGAHVYVNSGSSGNVFYTTNREAVSVLACLRDVYPHLFYESDMPIVRLAASEEGCTRHVRGVEKLFESIGRAFSVREEPHEEVTLSWADRVTILEWLREVAVDDPKHQIRHVMEVCSDGILRKFDRLNHGGRGGLFNNVDFALRVDPTTGRGVNADCCDLGIVESDFCVCYRCCHGRGHTFMDRILEGAKVFRMVSLYLFSYSLFEVRVTWALGRVSTTRSTTRTWWSRRGAGRAGKPCWG